MADGDDSRPVAHLTASLELGRDKLYFGQALYEEEELVGKNKSAKIFEENKPVKIKKESQDKNDLLKKNKLFRGDETARSTAFDNDEIHNGIKSENADPSSVLSRTDIPFCTNCGQNIAIANQQYSFETSLCVCCSHLFNQHQGVMNKQSFSFEVPENFVPKELRQHDIHLGVEAVKGFPLFANCQEDLSCYVDYKFPEVGRNFKVDVSKRETTSRVVCCEPLPVFSSIHRHTLALPVGLPLSPMLASHCPGVTLRLWLRYFKPTPRDHMVAMALLPMDELCLMEIEFDQKKPSEGVTKVLDLPLALVPSSVTAQFQQYSNQGVLRICVTYSHTILPVTAEKKQNHLAPVKSYLPETQVFSSNNVQITEDNEETADNNPNDSAHIKYDIPFSRMQQNPQMSFNDQVSSLPKQVLIKEEKLSAVEELKARKNQFWTGPFGKGSIEKIYSDQEKCIKIPSENFKYQRSENENFQYARNDENIVLKDEPINELHQNRVGTSSVAQCVGTGVQEMSSQAVMKEDFDILAESLEKRFNQLQSDLMKERQREPSDIHSIEMDSKPINRFVNYNVNNELFSFQSLSSNSSMDSLPFILGPPGNIKDLQNTVVYSKDDRPVSDFQSDKSVADTISGFLNEEREVANLGSNELFNEKIARTKPVKPKTFKATVKVDRAVNMKAVKGPSNGKKGKVPPSTWVSFGIGDCCERNCGTEELACTGQKFTTPIVRRSYNPIWNLSWDLDLPVDYLQQVNKRLVFRVFEENLNVAFGFASANLSILTSGLPCLSSWLSINDFTGTCKGQIKIIVTPLEDLTQYQECSVFDIEEDEFEDFKEHEPDNEAFSEVSNEGKSACFVASPTEVFVNNSEPCKQDDFEEKPKPKTSDDNVVGLKEEDPVSADDVISDYKHTLENNFRNEMAGLENLIRFLRVESVSNEMSFLGETENKENSNPTLQHTTLDKRASSFPETQVNFFTKSDSSPKQFTNTMGPKERLFVDASTETVNKNETPSNSNISSTEDVLCRLLQQISTFQLPTVKITDNTSQTVSRETRETCTETNIENCDQSGSNRTIHMKDAFTETADISETPNAQSIPPQTNYSIDTTQGPHVCGEFGSILLQHFLTCRPAAVKTSDSSCQTSCGERLASAEDSSGIFSTSHPSGMSAESIRDNILSSIGIPEDTSDWITSVEANKNCDRLMKIDNNIQEMEKFLIHNLNIGDHDVLALSDLEGGASGGSLNTVMDLAQGSVKDDNNPQSLSDVGSFESLSHDISMFRETPDGGSSMLPGQLDSCISSDNSSFSNDTTTGTTMKRRGTFVIDKSKDNAGTASHSGEGQGYGGRTKLL